MTLESARNTEKQLGAQQHDPRVDQLIARLPPRLSAAVRWLRQSSSAWIRRAAAILLICGGLTAFFPSWVFGCCRLACCCLRKMCRRSNSPELAFWIGSNTDTQIGSFLNATNEQRNFERTRLRVNGRTKGARPTVASSRVCEGKAVPPLRLSETMPIRVARPRGDL